MDSALTAIIGAVAGAIGSYYVTRRQNEKTRQREQQWQIYLNLGALERLSCPEAAKIPEDKYMNLFQTHREQILQNLVGSELPEMKEVMRAVNWVGFTDANSREVEFRRLRSAILRRLDPDVCRAAEEIKQEWGGQKEGDVGPELPPRND